MCVVSSKCRTTVFYSICAVSRQELVGWLQQQIAEQKRADLATSSAPIVAENIGVLPPKDVSISPDVQLILPIDTKKQRKQVKQLFLDRGAQSLLSIRLVLAYGLRLAFDTAMDVRSSIQNRMPTIALDVSADVFDSMVRNPKWVNDDEAWKTLLATFPPQTSTYAYQIREAVAKRRVEGHPYVFLFAVRDERVQLLNLS